MISDGILVLYKSFSSIELLSVSISSALAVFDAILFHSIIKTCLFIYLDNIYSNKSINLISPHTKYECSIDILKLFLTIEFSLDIYAPGPTD